ncbi:hypothetical protein NM897_16900 (plasmid) [Planococcus maritimus]|uniref:hypothetical protein n=1 Tax=Planococcus maritimus TaxID=192421 RepID=UPI00313A3A02
MRKKEIANELLKNTVEPLNVLLSNYLLILSELEEGYESDEQIMRLHYCIKYIEENNFDVEDWGLFEIPHSSVHAFHNKNTDCFFDLTVHDTGEVSPEYLDNEYNMQGAKSIQDAIANYYVS